MTNKEAPASVVASVDRDQPNTIDVDDMELSKNKNARNQH
jgi:hypothetical protein